MELKNATRYELYGTRGIEEVKVPAYNVLTLLHLNFHTFYRKIHSITAQRQCIKERVLNLCRFILTKTFSSRA